MSITEIMSSAVSAIRANASRVGAAADNIVNLNVKDYAAKDVRTATLAAEQAPGTQYTPGGVKIAVIEQGQVDLASEFTKMIEAKSAYEANIETVKTASEMAKSLYDIKA